MKKKLPIEEALEQKLQQIPQPDQETSWQAMKLLLEKDKRRPAFIFRRRNVIALLIMLLSAALLLWKNNEKSALNTRAKDSIVKQEISNESNKNSEQSNNNQNKENITTTTEINKADNAVQTEPTSSSNSAVTNSSIVLSEQTSQGTNADAVQKIKKKKRASKGRLNANIIAATLSDDPSSVSKEENEEKINEKKKKKTKSALQSNVAINSAIPSEVNVTSTVDHDPVMKTDEVVSNRNVNLLPVDSSNIAAIVPQMKTLAINETIKDSLKQSDTAIVTNTPKRKNDKKKPFVFSAGIGFKQQIPLSQQKISRYGFNGRNSVVNDYIPSVYFRVEKEKKWFTMLELDLAAPRMKEPVVYSQQTSVNNFSAQQKITRLELRKIFYQKIGLSYHRFIKPSWSVGAGLHWSKLYRTISTKNVTIKNLQNQSEETNTQVIPSNFNDSFLFKSVPSFTLQTNYEWRRFNLGLRWTSDLQPYIKFTRPSGEIVERKDQVLELLLYIRLWKSKRN
jgi:hypothetical protein